MEDSVNHVMKYVQTLVYHVLMETGVSTMQTLSEVLFLQQERTLLTLVFVRRITYILQVFHPISMLVGLVTRIRVGILYAPLSPTTSSTNDCVVATLKRSALPLTRLPTSPLVTSSSKIIRLPRSLDSELYRAHLATEALLSLSAPPVQPHRLAPSLHQAASLRRRVGMLMARAQR